MSRLSDLLTQQLEARLKIQEPETGTGTETNTVVTEQGSPAAQTETQGTVETQTTQQNSLVSLLKQSGVALPEGVDDVSAAKQLADLVAANQRREQEFLRLQQEHADAQEKVRQAELRALALQQQTQQTQVDPVKAKQDVEVKKWSQIDIDPSLAAICKFDETSRRFVPNPEFGLESQNAAAKLNAAAQEQSRRERLLLNDPLAALNEAGLTDVVARLVDEKINGFKGDIQKTYEQRRQEAEQARALQEQQREEAEFFEKHQSEFFQMSDGMPLRTVSGNPALTPRGQEWSQRVQQLSQQFGNTLRQIDIAKLALQMLPPPVDPQQQAKQQAEVKKEGFIDKARGNKGATAPSRQMSQSEIQRVIVDERPVLEGTPRFADMFRNDPANKEFLARAYGVS